MEKKTITIGVTLTLPIEFTKGDVVAAGRELGYAIGAEATYSKPIPWSVLNKSMQEGLVAGAASNAVNCDEHGVGNVTHIAKAVSMARNTGARHLIEAAKVWDLNVALKAARRSTPSPRAKKGKKTA